MTSPSKPDLAAPPAPAADGDLVVVEAPTTEEAIAEVSQRVGGDAEIVAADRVYRGGIGGFFTREMVQLTARRRRVVEEDGTPAIPVGGIDAVLARLQADVEQEERTFGEVLREELARERATAPAGPVPTPAPPPAAPAAPTATGGVAPPPVASPSLRPAVDAPAGTGGVRWSRDALARLDLPEALVEAGHGLDEGDELRWMAAVGGAVSSLCRPLPAGSWVLVGPRTRVLAPAIGLPEVVVPDLPPYGGAVALRTGSGKRGREWLAHVRGDRWLHVAAGGRGWRGFLDEGPLALSWTDGAVLPEVLRLAFQHGLVLGYGTSGGAAPVVRASPLEVALAVRDLLPRA